jgi:hypothetical protein
MVAANTSRSWLTVCSLADFVAITLAAVRTVGTSGRFGRKVYVSALAGALGVNPGAPLDLFKRRLFDAHRARFLVLSRADLVSAMNPEAVELSSIKVSGAEFHFVADPLADDVGGAS